MCAQSFLNDPGRTRACNPRLRGPMPCPLGHGANSCASIEITAICDNALPMATGPRAVIAQLAARKSQNPKVVSSILTHRIGPKPINKTAGCSVPLTKVRMGWPSEPEGRGVKQFSPPCGPLSSKPGGKHGRGSVRADSLALLATRGSWQGPLRQILALMGQRSKGRLGFCPIPLVNLAETALACQAQGPGLQPLS